MKNRYIIFLVLITLISCKNQDTKENKIPDSNIKIEMVTDYGTMQIELYNETPKHRDNFLKLTKDGVLDSLLFHRVINSFMIQGGDVESKYAKAGDTLGNGDLGYTIDAEFHPDLFHKKGVLAAARRDHPERASSSSQFYLVQGKVFNDSLLDVSQNRINTWIAEYHVKKDSTYSDISSALYKALDNEDMETYIKLSDSVRNIAKTYTNFIKYIIPEEHRHVYKTIGGTPHLDQNYTVFGEVLEGINIIDSIAKVETDSMDRPINDVRILKVTVLNSK